MPSPAVSAEPPLTWVSSVPVRAVLDGTQGNGLAGVTGEAPFGPP